MVAFITIFLVSITNQLLSSVLGVYYADVHYAILGAGMHVSLFAVGTLLGKLFLLPRRMLVPKKMVVAGMSITVTACIGYLVGGLIFANKSAIWIILCRIIQGFGFSLAGSASPLLMTSGPKNCLIKGVSYYGIATSLAALFGNPSALHIYSVMPGQTALAFISIIILLCAVAACILCPKTVSKESGPAKSALLRNVWDAFKEIWYLFLFFLLFQVLLSMFNILIPLYSKQIGELLGSSVFLAVTTVFSLGIRFCLPAIMKRFRSNIVLTSSGILYVLAIVCCLFCKIDNIAIAMFFGGMLSGISNGILMSIMQIIILLQIPEEMKPKINIIYLLTMDISYVISGAFWSLIVNRFCLTTAFSIAGFLMTFVMALCIGMLKHSRNIQ